LHFSSQAASASVEAAPVDMQGIVLAWPAFVFLRFWFQPTISACFGAIISLGSMLMHRRSWHSRIVSEISDGMRASSHHPVVGLSTICRSPAKLRSRFFPFAAGLAVAVVVFAAATSALAQTATQVTSGLLPA
jgi:hypothetical protein